MLSFRNTAIALLCAVTVLCANGQTISTVAGGGTYKPSQSALGTQASFCSITAIARDPTSGVVYFADYGCSGGAVVYKLTGDLSLSVVAGNGSVGYSGDGGAATNATFNLSIGGLAVAPSGNLYISDTFNNVVRKVTVATGIISTYAGGTVSTYGNNEPALYVPMGLFSTSTTLYIADNGTHRIRTVKSGSTAVTTIAGNGTIGFLGDGGSAKNAEFTNPWSLVLDSQGNIYIGDIGLNGANCRVREIIASTGVINTFAGGAYCGYSGSGVSAVTAQLGHPKGLAVDTNNNVYIADDSGMIREVSSGIIQTIAGQLSEGFSGDGGSPTSAQLKGPQGAAVVGSGSAYYIADTGNGRVRKVQ